MKDLVASEFRKFFTTRTWWTMAILVGILGAAFAVLFAFSLTTGYSEAERQEFGIPSGDETQIANSVYSGGLTLGIVLLLVIGVLQIGQEYRHKTITSTLLSEPNRAKAMLAKVLALLGVGGLYGLISVGCSLIAGALMLNQRGLDPFPSPTVYRTLILCLVVLGLWALIGLGLGILIPHQVAAILLGVGVTMVVEPIAGAVMASWEFTSNNIVPYLPQSATNATIDAVQVPGAEVLAWWQGLLVLVGYAVVLSGLGIIRVMRQDIA